MEKVEEISHILQIKQKYIQKGWGFCYISQFVTHVCNALFVKYTFYYILSRAYALHKKIRILAPPMKSSGSATDSIQHA